MPAATGGSRTGPTNIIGAAAICAVRSAAATTGARLETFRQLLAKAKIQHSYVNLRYRLAITAAVSADNPPQRSIAWTVGELINRKTPAAPLDHQVLLEVLVERVH